MRLRQRGEGGWEAVRVGSCECGQLGLCIGSQRFTYWTWVRGGSLLWPQLFTCSPILRSVVIVFSLPAPLLVRIGCCLTTLFVVLKHDLCPNVIIACSTDEKSFSLPPALEAGGRVGGG